MINKLKYDFQTNNPLILSKSGLNPNSTSAGDSHNAGYIIDKLRDAGYEPITDKISFSGSIQTNGSLSKIHWSYNNFPEGTIYIKTL